MPRPDFQHNTTSCSKGQFLGFSTFFDVQMFGELCQIVQGLAKIGKAFLLFIYMKSRWSNVTNKTCNCFHSAMNTEYVTADIASPSQPTEIPQLAKQISYSYGDMS